MYACFLNFCVDVSVVKICMYLQINDNGVISFGSRYNPRTPLSFPLSGTDKVIAPYWADVDTRGSGDIYYRQTTDPSLLARATSEIRAVFSMSQNVTITSLLIVTWNKVGYYYVKSDKVGNLSLHQLHVHL